MLEIVSVLSTEATARKERLPATVMGALITKLRELIGITKNLSAL
jgi:hypothetical protein